MNSFMIAAPHSGSGKTVVTLGLLRAFRDEGLRIASGKAGPDYIDPAFHAAASGRDCVNLDPWAMRLALLQSLSADFFKNTDISIVEAMMGLFDGAADGTGSAADLAAQLGLPVVLVVDASRMAHSVAALVNGFKNHRRDVPVAGVILNRVGSERHEGMLRDALGATGLPVFGVIPSSDALALPSRHLGLVQAGEHGALETFITDAAKHVGSHCDLAALGALNTPATAAAGCDGLKPLGQHIAIARDAAFAFSYPHLIRGWRDQGAQVSFFSPLSDEAPDAGADAVYLPGGYPELHAGAIADARVFAAGLANCAARGALIYGECGGYMVLGEALIDADGARHAMTGHLPLVTSFAKRQRHLGYRAIKPLGDGLPWRGELRGHEFHYSVVEHEGAADRLFAARDALDNDLGQVGLQRGNVCGSYLHVIDAVN